MLRYPDNPSRTEGPIHRVARAAALVTLTALLAACSTGTDVVLTARVDSAGVSANPNMVVSALVRFGGIGDSARVRFHVAGSAVDSTTPAFTGPFDVDTLPVLGLLPQTTYVFRAVVYGSGTDSATSDSLTLTTGSLPVDLPAYTAGGSNPMPGYVVMGVSGAKYGIVIDRTGRVVWYRFFPPGGPGLNFMAQPTGVYVGRSTTPDVTDIDPMVEIDAAGFERRALRCVGRPLRFHDMILLADGSYWIMCDDVRTQDLSSLGGSATAVVTGTAVQHVSAAGTLLFEWDPFDHFLITDTDPTTYVGTTNVNWTHGNSLDLDTDGNLLVSFRSLSEITKINTQSGAVIWRMGGRRNQFTFAGAAGSGFARQHNLRVIGPNAFIVLDNVGSTDSRYERYLTNAATMTATLQQSYSAVPAVQTMIGGSVQQEASDRYLVSFGTTGRVEEFDLAGNTTWKINGNPGYVFRAQRILSLYQPIPAVTR